jgi:hypothetical protein
MDFSNKETAFKSISSSTLSPSHRDDYHGAAMGLTARQ